MRSRALQRLAPSLPLSLSLVVGCPASTEPAPAGTTAQEPEGSETGPSSVDDDGSTSTGASETTVGSGSGTSTGEDSLPCFDVAGDYELSIDVGGEGPCRMLVDAGNVCTVSQLDCELSWECDSPHASALTPGPLDADGNYIAEGSYMDHGYACAFEFSPDEGGFDWSCSIGIDAPAICGGTGTRTM